ncbi:MAG: spermidine/putrescine transport system permease protein [Gaiellales bacterium]|nr:spermidine/putrescine transport system permease protein [Gaiellales bacterium]MDX6618420.1 spermidine/putrescine transport system permease protein [Gaiellales bacterium]
MKRKRSFAPRYPARLTLPVLAYDAIFFLGPLAILVVFSLAKTVGFGQVSYALSGGNFSHLWDSLYLDIFKTTLEMATIGTLLTLLVGYPMAYWMARCLTTGKSLALILVIIPFLTSFLIRTYAWFIILDPQGYLVRALHHLGFDGWRPLYSTQAIGVGLVYGYMPLLILPVYASLERMDWSLVDAALDLGASPFRAFRQVTIPLSLPGLVTGVLLVFIPMTGEYVIPSLLGGGKREFVGNAVGDQFLVAQDWPLGAAMAIALMIVLSVFLIVYLAFATREEQFGA